MGLPTRIEKTHANRSASSVVSYADTGADGKAKAGVMLDRSPLAPDVARELAMAILEAADSADELVRHAASLWQRSDTRATTTEAIAIVTGKRPQVVVEPPPEPVGEAEPVDVAPEPSPAVIVEPAAAEAVHTPSE